MDKGESNYVEGNSMNFVRAISLSARLTAGFEQAEKLGRQDSMQMTTT